MARRERGESLRAGSYYALSRASCLVAAVEVAQLFTASHVADWRDLSRGWIFCAGGTLTAIIVLWLRPLIYRDPAVLAGPAVTILCPLAALWLAHSALGRLSSGQAGSHAWLPIMDSYTSSWNAVLSAYAGSLLQYMLAVGALAGCLRLRGQVPRLKHCLAVALAAALTLQAVGVLFFGRLPDTSQLALALLAGLLVQRLDAALLGTHPPKPASLPHSR